MDRFKVSVCISVHNTASLLPRCLDSVVNQTLDSLQIVLVNNGSTDNSLDIMYEYQNAYPTRDFVIVSQEDKGLAQGRQTGVDNANGEYICFLDADDFVDITAYEKMYNNAIKNNSDIVEIQTIKGDRIIASPFDGSWDADSILKKYLSGKPFIYPMIWMRMYKRELFNHQVFPDIYVNNEDIFAFPCLLASAKRISYINEVLHTYSIDNESAVMSELKKKSEERRYYENRKKILFVPGYVELFLKNHYIGEDLSAYLYQYKQSIILEFLFSKTYSIEYEETISDIFKILDFQSRAEFNQFMKKYSYSDRRINMVIRLLGVEHTYSVMKLFAKGGR